MVDAPHTLSTDEILTKCNVTLSKGLSNQQVEVLREKYGRNELDKEEGKSIWELLKEQFEDLLVRILLAAAVVSFVLAYFENAEEGLAAFIEPLVILLILIANAIVGVWQESNAEKALEALKDLQSKCATVIRDGQKQVIQAWELVPGDIVEVRVGDKVPADMRIIELKTTTLRIEQSQLTGESMSVAKDVQALKDAQCEIQSKVNMLFASTTVSNGTCIGVVTATGMKTEIGIIQAAVTEAAEEETQTPLAQKIDEFGEMLAKVIFFICAVVWVINYKHFFDPVHGNGLRGCIYYFKIAVALAVAAIPEGLPAVITTCLALGTRKMAKRNCIVRKLPSVETLGCTTIICSDKTGTLTTNEMCCVRLCMPVTASALKERSVEGHTYTPVGAVEDLAHVGVSDIGLQTFCKIASLCNESHLEIKDGKYQRIGEPTEAALRVLVEKMGCPDAALNARALQAGIERGSADAMAFSNYWESSYKKLATLEFSRDRKSMSVICQSNGANSLFCKGAPESLLDRCDTIMMPDGRVVQATPATKKEVMKLIEDLASQALRTLGFAIKTELGPLADYNGPSHPQHKAMLGDPSLFVNVEKGMTFVGLVGIHDPPRPECRKAIADCRRAGIAVVMITGDNKRTAEAISKQLGIVDCNEDLSRKSFTGREFEELSTEQKHEVLRDTDGAVFSRTEPRHKQIIVKILKELGEICAMTGDGVNDAPALKQADIGIAMGIAGTEVAKEAAAMVLTDDNFSTIVSAVEEGRSIYNNMKAFIRYLISSNIGEVASIFLTAALGIPEGLAPVQLLWVNLVTDGLPATALGFNPPDVNVMSKPPRRKDDPLISGWVFFRYMVVGMYVGFATVGIFVWWFVFDVNATDGHTLVTLGELMTWGTCSSWEGFTAKAIYNMDPTDACTYFTVGKIKASTLSLTVLVMIEMLNALNALSEDGSLLVMPPWANPWLLLAMLGSIIVHLVVVYHPFFNAIFGLVPLTCHDWVWVGVFSFPVIIIDEILKFCGRRYQASHMVFAHGHREKME